MNALGSRFTRAWILLASAGFSIAQVPLSPAAEKLAIKMFDGTVHGDKLDCDASERQPFFDFSFRFELGYVVRCAYRQFNGEANHLVAIVRVRPMGGAAVLLGDGYVVPAIPDNLRGKLNIRKFKDELEFSRAIGLGEGEYEVELLVADGSNRFFRKRWKTRAERRGPEKKAEVSMQPGQVAPLLLVKFDPQEFTSAVVPLRITVLLNAAPINPYSRKLRAWDRAFLLGSVASLMRQVPSAKVRLVAFNTDQQKEVFRSEILDRPEFTKLNEALRGLELGTISYHTLENSAGWAQLLDRIVAEKAATDVVVFLGPQMRQDAKPQSQSCRTDQPLFYLKYFAFVGVQYPDSLDQLTKDCKGRVLGFHSPGELGAAIEKMRRSLTQN